MWISVFLIIVNFLLGLGAQLSVPQDGSCDSGWFGETCQFKCHCANQMDCLEDGSCPEGVQCDRGWFGPACQYADLAQENNVVSPAHGDLTDGDDDTCETLPSSVTIQFSWNTTFFFTWIRMRYKPLPGRTPRFVMAFTEIINGDMISCDNERTVQVGNTYDVTCNTTTVQQMFLTSIDVQALCSVHVSGGRNVALKQIASQSANAGDSDPSKVVDGYTNVIDQSSCYRMDPYYYHPSWNLTFQTPQIVFKYVLYAQNDATEHLRNFVLRAFDSYDIEVFSHLDAGNTRLMISVPPSSPMSVNKVQISTIYDYDYMLDTIVLCELEIYGESDCPLGYYGLECNNTCNCAEEEDACLVSTGGCPSGCAPGYTGEECQEECSPTFYGKDCQWKCTQSCLGQLCHHVTGHCQNCPIGKTGIYCHDDCSAGWFGASCSQQCSLNCGGDGSCDVVDGVCKSGCQDGYSGLMCNTDCQLGWFGQNCSTKCSANCRGDGSCGKVDGTCSLGCISGFKGNMCTTACMKYSFGENCANNCSESCAEDGTCSALDGTCSHGCKDGYTGALCNDVCPPRFYGPSCQHACGEYCVIDNITEPGVCHHVSGSCLLGCQDGHEGTRCSDDANQSVAPLIGVSCGLGLAAVIIIILISLLCWRSRHEDKRKSIYDGVHESQPDEQTYETFDERAVAIRANPDVVNELQQTPTNNAGHLSGISNNVYEYEDTTFQNQRDSHLQNGHARPRLYPRILNKSSTPPDWSITDVTHTIDTKTNTSMTNDTGPDYTNS